MADVQLLLWLDTESTGLLTDRTPPTALEVAWTVTDWAGQQVTPLRQRFTALPMGASGAVHTPELAEVTGQAVGYWDGATYPGLPVRELHDDEHSGLTTEWASFADAHPDRVLRDWAEVERLILDDLHEGGWSDLDARQVCLAGGGTSHYEHLFGPQVMPRLFGDRRMHYGDADISVILRALKVRAKGLADATDWPGKADDVIARLRHTAGRYLPSSVGHFSWPDMWISGDQFDADGGDWGGWHRDEADNHRAAEGVGRALMAWRLLPYVFGLLDPAAAAAEMTTPAVS